ncbi:glycosyltransferase family 52 [Anaerostipes faecalis]|uniref:glycosyltransferase family 52 n=1 Tax=Anaerostipes faecalis TaxID=2738446 RepID=UPI001C1E13F9|nr:glycosyltransferase family 52 [Anaerostipes faecalis]
MVLYIGASLYHILCFSIHKLLNHPTEKAVLIIGDNIFSKSGMKELKRNLEASGLFHQVIVLNFIEGAYDNPYKLNEDSPGEKVDSYIQWNEQWIENWMRKKKIDLSHFTEFNSAIDHRHMGMYLLSKKIPYQYFEDGNGLLSRESVQLDFHKKAQYASYAVTVRLHALGNSQYVTKKYANASAQQPGFYDEKMEDFNVIQLFPKLAPDWRDKVLKMFNARKLQVKGNKQPVLYLTRYVRYLQNPTMDNHHFISAMILDLFAKESPVIIKPHPRDFSGRYRDLFPDAVVLDKHFPSELLPFIYDGKFEKIITTGSTAIDALMDYTDELIKLDVGFENKIDAIYQYIGAVQLVQKIFPGISPEEIGIIGCLREFIDPLCQQFLGFRIPEPVLGRNYKVVLADDVTEPLPSADCVCYLNTKQDYYFADVMQESFDDIFYLNIQVMPEEDPCYGKKKETAVYIKTDCLEIKEKIEHFYHKTVFPRTGISMTMGTGEKEKQEYLTMLSEIFWIKCRRERENPEIVFPVMSEIKRKITKEDVKSLRQLLAVMRRKEKEENEDNCICTNEIK